MSNSTAAIEAVKISAGYGQIPVLREVSLYVNAGEVVALVGANGVGKTTTLLTLAGELPLSSGVIRLAGRPTSAPLHQRAREGLRLITEDRAVFMTLTVADNLRLVHKCFDEPLAIFPELEPLLSRKVGLLSGGEQQMVTLARALTGTTKVLLADELSLGLAPLVVKRLLGAVRAAADRGMAVLLVEQQVRNAFAVADRAYVLRRGKVVMQGATDELKTRISEVEASYLTSNMIEAEERATS
jgi:branched-chain amino acid transport system ATP-binding protein